MSPGQIRSSTLVELHVPDFGAVERYYGGLGFSKEFQEPEYRVYRLQDNLLCFFGGSEGVYAHSYFKKFGANAPRGVGVEIILLVNNLDELFTRADQLNSVVAPISARAWGARDFRAGDPFGYYLRFTEPYRVVR